MVLKRQILAIQDVYVPVKRRQTLDPHKVEAMAESIMDKGQDAPILVRPDGHREPTAPLKPRALGGGDETILGTTRQTLGPARADPLAGSVLRSRC